MQLVYFLLLGHAMRVVRPFGLMVAGMIAAGLSTHCEFRSFSCETDRDCSAGMVCNGYYGTCETPACRSDKDCDTGKVCTVSYTCEIGCRKDEDCGTGFVCSSVLFDSGPAQCVAGCRSDGDCAAGTVCAQKFLSPNACTAGCRTNADCGPRTFCPGEPKAFFIGIEEVPTCSTGCHDDGECASNELCAAGTCAARCRDSTECTTGQLCASLHAAGSFRKDDAGRLLPCTTTERCLCAEGAAATPDAGTDARSGAGGSAP